MADAGDKIVKRKEREPITLVCFVVFLVACAGVLSAYAYDNFIADDSETVVYGDKVVIDYTGSLYGYYDSSTDTVIPVIFDTTLKNVYEDSNNVLAAGFTKTSFGTTNVTIGAGNFLKAFESSLIGHKVGDTVMVKIDAKDAYPAANSNIFKASSDAFSLNKVFTITADDYKTLFDKTTVPTQGTATLDDKNGLSANVTYNGSQIDVRYNLVIGEYTIVDNKVGKVTLVVTDDTDTIKYTLKVENAKTVEGSTKEGNNNSTSVQEIEMISFDLFGVKYNVVGYDSNGIVYNTATTTIAAIQNMDLYFVIKIVGKS